MSLFRAQFKALGRALGRKQTASKAMTPPKSGHYKVDPSVSAIIEEIPQC